MSDFNFMKFYDQVKAEENPRKAVRMVLLEMMILIEQQRWSTIDIILGLADPDDFSREVSIAIPALPHRHKDKLQQYAPYIDRLYTHLVAAEGADYAEVMLKGLR